MYKVFLFSLSLLVISCQKKTVKATSDDKVELQAPTITDMVRNTPESEDQIRPEKEPIVNDCYSDRKVERTIVKGKGKIIVQGKYILIDRPDKGSRFLPCDDQIPRAFRKNGMDVVFTGAVLNIRPNERLRGTPFRLQEISSK